MVDQINHMTCLDIHKMLKVPTHKKFDTIHNGYGDMQSIIKIFLRQNARFYILFS